MSSTLQAIGDARPVLQMSTIYGMAIGFCGLYLLVVGRITVTEFGAMAATATPFLLAREPHTPTVSSSSGSAVPIVIEGKEP